MTQEQERIQDSIKKSCEYARRGIKMWQDDLESTQRECEHPRTFEGLYSYRVGSIEPAIICSDCGKLVCFKKDEELTLNQTFTHGK